MSNPLILVTVFFLTMLLVAIATMFPKKTGRVNANRVALRLYARLIHEFGSDYPAKALEYLALEMTEELTGVRLPRVRVEEQPHS